MSPALGMAIAAVVVFVIAAVTMGAVEYIASDRCRAARKCGPNCPWCPSTAYHAPDCDGSACDECGYIAADGYWYPGECPAADQPHQAERAEGYGHDSVQLAADESAHK